MSPTNYLHTGSAAVNKFIRRTIVQQLYAAGACCVLLLSTLWWSLQGARLQLANADALVDPYLFRDARTFHGANFPMQHTQLLKWPFFFLIKLLGYSSTSFTVVTVLLVLLTVGSLVTILYWTDRRLLIFGTACLALATILILVPPQPYPGGLLPVNMAMISTRNIEYIVYIISLLLVARTTQWLSWQFWLAVVMSALLIASDKLFMVLGLLAASLALFNYAVARRWELVRLGTNWLGEQLLATLMAAVCVLLLNTTKVTHVVNGQASVSPYGPVTNLHSVTIGSIYAVLNIFTNNGANPAYDVTLLRNVPQIAIHRVLGTSGLPLLVNALLTIGGICAAAVLLYRSVRHREVRNPHSKLANRLSLLLIWSAVAAIVVFVISNHTYSVDARYLSITSFALIIASVSYARRLRWKLEYSMLVGFMCCVALVLGAFLMSQTVASEQSVLAETGQRNHKLVDALALHPVDTLVGDYWRVVTAEFLAGHNLSVLPLAGCTNPRTDLTSNAWQLDLRKHSFAYLLSYDRSLTNYPQCSVGQVIAAYGRPDTSVLIAGTLDHPVEQLLYYDHGSHKGHPSLLPLAQTTLQPATITPVSLNDLPNASISCPVPSVMAIVAHEDDDILFMNPDIIHALRAGYCVRTVYMTAGDGGFGQYYWLARQLGSEAAYAKMMGISNHWADRIIKIADNEFVTIATARDNARVSLVFVHLPDGNLTGGGFASSGHESLARLVDRQISSIRSVDGQSIYTKDQLVSMLNALMIAYSPSIIYTQSTVRGTTFPDHIDHITVGKLATAAYNLYEQMQFNNFVSIPIHYYKGYPVHSLPPNIAAPDVAAKTDIFLTYAQYDGTVCHTVAACHAGPSYGVYLTRQYQANN